MSEIIEISGPIDEQVFGRFVLGGWKSSGNSARAALVVASAICLILFGLAAERLALPGLAGFQGSLMLGPSPFVGILAVAVLFVAATLVGTVVAGAVRFEAGLFSAAVGLIAVSVNGGTMLTTLHKTSGGQGVFFTLAFELLLLGIIVAIAWVILWRMGSAGFVKPPEEHLRQEPIAESENYLLGGLTATAAQVVATGLILMVLCRSQQKNQALASMLAASFLGTVVAYKFAPARPSCWYWSGPLLLGIIGYLIEWMANDPSVVLGIPTATFAALVNPLPLDYAGAGVAGAIFAYWMMRTPEPSGADPSGPPETT